MFHGFMVSFTIGPGRCVIPGCRSKDECPATGLCSFHQRLIPRSVIAALHKPGIPVTERLELVNQARRRLVALAEACDGESLIVGLRRRHAAALASAEGRMLKSSN